MSKKSAAEICTELEELLKTDTNTLISVSSGDRHLKNLARELNSHLRLLRDQRRTYQNGDRKLKEAVTNISHDLRTPLTAICGYLDLLKMEEMSEDAVRYLGFVDNRTQALKQLTEELFRYSVMVSTVGEMEAETVNLNSLLEESIAAFHGALTYSDGDLDISLSADGEVVFTNTAADLDEIQAGKLFDRFFSVNTAKNSTGLGLSISKTLVEQMGGTITARCQAGKLILCVKFTNQN